MPPALPPGQPPLPGHPQGVALLYTIPTPRCPYEVRVVTCMVGVPARGTLGRSGLIAWAQGYPVDSTFSFHEKLRFTIESRA
jgi:hypothetical protein